MFLINFKFILYYIKLSIYELEEKGNKIYYEFLIEDTGIGIAEDKLKYIFNKFYQAENYMNKKYEGTGLGLAISEKFISYMGGDIKVDSKVGIGSKFIIKIPLIKENHLFFEEEKEENKLGNLESNIKILIAEDNYLNIQLMEKIMKKGNYNYEIVYNGKEALEKFEKKYYDIIFMDIQMPEMDGFEATKRIKNINKNVIIIGLSAYAFENEKEKALEIGMDDYLKKPVVFQQIYEIIKKHIK